ncbi:hypothetical protein PYCCODRAFT_1525346 [Trametes coccinea BRFM310]|uniref:F-box domain-containing protein n=1 Tax=Trametes coccinea (strain BRFM310) TaxID=1353009 RepID=A0A1Y2IA06_TRAC3|nr:hypothetical protein PYCCODRAFT_1525346 [Trametes coccinea BRFM310]
MGQMWYLINLDSQEIATYGKLAEWFWFEDFHEIRQALRIRRLPDDVDLWLAKGTRATQRGPLLTLPDEIICMIYAELSDSDVSILCLAVTCKDLLALGKPHILRHLRHAGATWACGRIICVGEYLHELNDLPSGMLTAQEEEAIKAAFDDDADSDVDGASMHGRLSFWEYVQDTYAQNVSGYNTRCSATEKVFKIDWRSWCRRPANEQRDYNMVDKLLEPGSEFGLNHDLDVLCNISKGECVRSAALNMPKAFTIGHALVSQVCWSTDPSCSMYIEPEFERKLVRGRWAGDRFCLVTEDTMPELPGGAEWRDVTAEVHELLCHLHNQNPWVLEDEEKD